jgi:acetylornithine/succinyldiaminopimelate/putrescine aminotransferase
MSASLATQKQFMLNLYPNRGLVFNRGRGMFLYSPEGDEYLDMMSNYGVNILGYGHPALHAALAGQLELLPTLHCSFTNETRAAASRRLVERLPGPPGRVYWSNSGAEAVEAALKLAVLATGRKKFIACRNGYHGKTLGALSATDGEKYRRAFEPLLWRFVHIPYDDPQALEGAVGGDTAAFVVEPIQGEGGLAVPRDGYLHSVREICSGRGILLILDEVQTGVGRTGAFLASAREGISADIVCLGKGLGGGMPVGATIVTPEIAAHAVRSVHTSTFGGNPLACAGANAVLDYLDAEALDRIGRLGAHFRRELERLPDDRILEVRGKGLMLGIAVRGVRDDILKGLQREKVLAIPAGSDVVRFLPPYVLETEHIDRTLEALRRVLRIL